MDAQQLLLKVINVFPWILELSNTARGNVKWHSTLENSLGLPQKVEQSYHLTQQFHL